MNSQMHQVGVRQVDIVYINSVHSAYHQADMHQVVIPLYQQSNCISRNFTVKIPSWSDQKEQNIPVPKYKSSNILLLFCEVFPTV